MGAKEDYQMPLHELYDSLPISSQQWINARGREIKTLFVAWIVFLFLCASLIIYLVLLNPFKELIAIWFQRSGAIITLISSFSEAVFVVRFNRLVKVSHWAKLTPEIYVERMYRKLLILSLAITSIIITIGTLIWGYGDIIWNKMFV